MRFEAKAPQPIRPSGNLAARMYTQHGMSAQETERALTLAVRAALATTYGGEIPPKWARNVLRYVEDQAHGLRLVK